MSNLRYLGTFDTEHVRKGSLRNLCLAARHSVVALSIILVAFSLLRIHSICTRDNVKFLRIDVAL